MRGGFHDLLQDAWLEGYEIGFEGNLPLTDTEIALDFDQEIVRVTDANLPEEEEDFSPEQIEEEYIKTELAVVDSWKAGFSSGLSHKEYETEVTE